MSARGAVVPRPALVSLVAFGALAWLSVTGATDALAAGHDRAGESQEWWETLSRAAASATEHGVRGEVVWTTRTPSGERSSVVRVESAAGRVAIEAGHGVALRLGDFGGAVVDRRQGWMLPLPTADPWDPAAALDLLARNYRIERAATEPVADRRCTRIDFYRRADGRLAERLWFDQETGLAVRRETFDSGGERLRQAAYRELEVVPGRSGAPEPEGMALSQRHLREGAVVDPDRVGALRLAGYALPGRLPGGFERLGSYASGGTAGAWLQTVYSDGLYTVSMFQVRGRPDPASLPDGARLAPQLDWPAYDWPGAVPHRLLWEASGSTFFLTGDAPPEALAAAAEVLPRPATDRPLDRLWRGLGRIWSAVSP